MKAPATLELQPGVGVGSLQLGMAIWDILNHLSSDSSGNSSIYSAQCTLAWDDHNPHSSAILLTLADRAISLLFDPVSQRLTTIQIEDPLVESLTYKGKPLIPSSTSQAAPLRLLHATFGPTYPPAPHPAFKDEAILSYPGVIFGFFKEYASSNVQGDTAAGMPKQPIRRVIVTGHNPNSENAALFPDFVNLSTSTALPAFANGDISHVEITLGNDSTPTSIALQLISSEQDAPSPVVVQLGITTTEDLLCELGPPNRIFYKEDSRLAIHSATPATNTGSDTSNTNGGAFYNYFALGLDFLIHPTSQRVQKIILYSNTPGEVLFGRYAKCRWTLMRHSQEAMDGNTSALRISGEDTAEMIKDFLGNPTQSMKAPSSSSGGKNKAKGNVDSKKMNNAATTRTERPLLLDRVADSGDGLKLDRTTELCAYPGVVLEVTQNNCIETLWLV